MARIEVPMPQMGESIAEGTVSKWLKQVGDPVEIDEPILEISTDKVDAAIPSPESGTLVEIGVQEGETVEVGAVVAYIETEAGAVVTPTSGESGTSGADADDPTDALDAPGPEEEPADGSAELVGAGVSSSDGHAAQAVAGGGIPATAEERVQTRSTPVVRKIAAEHGISIADVPGSGHAGRVTKQDILDFIENGAAKAATAASATAASRSSRTAAPPAVPGGSVTSSELWAAFYEEVHHPEFPVREEDHVEPMDKIRRLTAEHMVLAKRIAPHVHSFIELDFSLVDHHRRAHKSQWAAQGVRVSFTAFVVWS